MSKAAYYKSKAKGLCGTFQTTERMKPTARCRRCWFRFKAGEHLGDTSQGLELEQLLIRQDFKCAYTGELLELGVNASIEHIQPGSRYPHLINNLGNIAWVCKEINYMKRNNTLLEFIDKCRIVLERFGYEVKKLDD